VSVAGFQRPLIHARLCGRVFSVATTACGKSAVRRLTAFNLSEIRAGGLNCVRVGPWSFPSKVFRERCQTASRFSPALSESTPRSHATLALLVIDTMDVVRWTSNTSVLSPLLSQVTVAVVECHYWHVAVSAIPAVGTLRFPSLDAPPPLFPLAALSVRPVALRVSTDVSDRERV
jgi:hypothetical protein